ncbi:MAG TPA: VOC family protein, partial [Phycisphaerales bacterium]|nr:VOC family protein [Phycisphaerales bacterium]
WFDGNAEEAAAFYVSVFPDSRITTITRYGADGQEVHGRPPGSVMTVVFELCGQGFTALNGGPGFPFTQAVSFVVACDTQAEIDSYWERLTAGGGQPIACGWLKDRFGLSWQVVPAMLVDLVRDPVRGGGALRALWGMIKPDVAAIARAAGPARGEPGAA